MKLEDLEDNIELGRKIFESIPKKNRPGWGATLLQIFENYIDEIPTQVKELYKIAEDQKKWGQAHEQFRKIRTFALAHPDYQPESYIILAENVAKVVYNESGLSAPFDSNSGWSIPVNAKKTADYYNDPELKKEVLRVLLMSINKK